MFGRSIAGLLSLAVLSLVLAPGCDSTTTPPATAPSTTTPPVATAPVKAGGNTVAPKPTGGPPMPR